MYVWQKYWKLIFEKVHNTQVSGFYSRAALIYICKLCKYTVVLVSKLKNWNYKSMDCAAFKVYFLLHRGRCEDFIAY